MNCTIYCILQEIDLRYISDEIYLKKTDELHRILYIAGDRFKIYWMGQIYIYILVGAEEILIKGYS